MYTHRSELKDHAAFSIESFAHAHEIGRTKTLELIRSGKLIARKVGARTIITAEDARLWRENLPKAGDASLARGQVS
jgi:hypothetical protein